MTWFPNASGWMPGKGKFHYIIWSTTWCKFFPFWRRGINKCQKIDKPVGTSSADSEQSQQLPFRKSGESQQIVPGCHLLMPSKARGKTSAGEELICQGTYLFQ